jgi:1-deoxy-D-xylulose-5-phosphate reductoisomerase
MARIVILGATGSIGDSVFRVLENLAGEHQVVGMSGGTRVARLVEKARQWRPRRLAVTDAAQVDPVREQLPRTEILVGEPGLIDLAATDGVDLVINGLVGAVGLEPTLAALARGRTVAMANKEPLVMAGALILQTAAQAGATVLPLDSEPNAIWQCLRGEDRHGVRRLILTASGGPFFGRTRQEMAAITPAQALAHPTWRMGPKITVDSATLMNKGFEVLEASCLFGVGLDAIDVVIHRESVIHSMVEFVDGAIMAHLGPTDMVLPIQYALTHPQRRSSVLGSLDLTRVGSLSLAAPDREAFPCLDLCYAAGRQGGRVPAALNAANEVAVNAFLDGQIAFLHIHACVAHVTAQTLPGSALTVEDVLTADREARAQARAWVAAHVLPVPAGASSAP